MTWSIIAKDIPGLTEHSCIIWRQSLLTFGGALTKMFGFQKLRFFCLKIETKHLSNAISFFPFIFIFALMNRLEMPIFICPTYRRICVVFSPPKTSKHPRFFCVLRVFFPRPNDQLTIKNIQFSMGISPFLPSVQTFFRVFSDTTKFLPSVFSASANTKFSRVLFHPSLLFSPPFSFLRGSLSEKPQKSNRQQTEDYCGTSNGFVSCQKARDLGGHGKCFPPSVYVPRFPFFQNGWLVFRSWFDRTLTANNVLWLSCNCYDLKFEF